MSVSMKKTDTRELELTYLKTMEEFCKIKQINYIVLDVWNFNEEAIKFYKRIGMNPVTQRFEKPVA